MEGCPPQDLGQALLGPRQAIHLVWLPLSAKTQVRDHWGMRKNVGSWWEQDSNRKPQFLK